MADATTPKASVFKKLTFSLVPLVLLLGLGEVTARLFLRGDLQSQRLFYVAGGHEEYYGTRKIFMPYRTLPPYYWTGVPGAGFYNSAGFRGPDFPTGKASGVTRIVTMGCSCTACGQEAYAERLDRTLQAALATRRYEVLNGGLGSFSTYQGIQVLEQTLLPLKPDVVTIFFGWNDIWVHDGRRDSTHRLPGASSTKMREWLSGSRLFKAMVVFAERMQGDRKSHRVPPDEYEKNLRRIVRMCRDAGARPILLVTPDGLPESSIKARFTLDKNPRDWDADLYSIYADKYPDALSFWAAMRKTYNDIVWKVAREEKADIVDLDGLVKERRSLYEPDLQLFKDGVHFTELGLQEVASILATTVVAQADQAAVTAYMNSAPYFVDNAARLAAQFQYGAAERYLNEAGKRDPGSLAGQEQLLATIQSERPFFDRYDFGRIQLSNHGDKQKVLQAWQECLALKPENEDVRLDIANLLKDLGRHNEALQFALSFKDYTPNALHRALWIGVESAGATGQRDLFIQLLRDLDRLFPQDPRARQTLLQMQGGRR